MSGVSAVDTKRMDRNRKKGEGIENGICTQRMRGRAREKDGERKSKREGTGERKSKRRMNNLDDG